VDPTPVDPTPVDPTPVDPTPSTDVVVDVPVAAEPDAVVTLPDKKVETGKTITVNTKSETPVKKSIAPEWAKCAEYARAAGVSDDFNGFHTGSIVDIGYCNFCAFFSEKDCFASSKAKSSAGYNGNFVRLGC